MAVLTQSINDGFAQITTLLKQVDNTLKGNQGDLTKLSTADKTSLVNALNELKSTIDNKSAINDSQTTTANTWSATKISNEITTAITNLINGADASSDTLKGLADKIAALAQARNNIDAYSKAEIGDINTNFVTTINTTYNG